MKFHSNKNFKPTRNFNADDPETAALALELGKLYLEKLSRPAPAEAALRITSFLGSAGFRPRPYRPVRTSK